MLNTTEDLSSRVKREAVGCNKFFIAACSPALIEHEPTLYWAKVQHLAAANALASRRKHSSWLKNYNFPHCFGQITISLTGFNIQFQIYEL